MTPAEATGRGDQEVSRPHDVERLDVSGLADLVRQRRGSMSLRQTATEVGVSFSTLSRVESGAQPDLTSFMTICAWLGVPPSRFFAPVAERRRNPVEEFIPHLQADPRLNDRSARLIAEMLAEMYEKLAGTDTPTQPLLACHLRAASALRPGVPERLAGLLGDMNAALQAKSEAGPL